MTLSSKIDFPERDGVPLIVNFSTIWILKWSLGLKRISGAYMKFFTTMQHCVPWSWLLVPKHWIYPHDLSHFPEKHFLLQFQMSYIYKFNFYKNQNFWTNSVFCDMKATYGMCKLSNAPEMFRCNFPCI